jgi:signal transduction histidine kinase
MIPAPIPSNDLDRVNALHEYAIMDSEQESDYDAIVNLASSICEAPISLVTLINEDRQWYKAKTGIDGSETPRELAFCAFTILDNELFEVEDTWKDVRFFQHPSVDGDPNIRFYAGMPLRSPSGYNLGSLCVIDRVPRKLTEFQKSALQTLSQQVIKLFELRRKNRELNLLQDTQSRMMSIIGHDLRTPIASINALLEILDEYDMSMEELKKLLPDIRKSAESTGELVINLLDWAQSQMAGLKINTSSLPIRFIVQSVMDDNNRVFERKSNTVVNRVDENLNVIGDRRMIEFIFRNLILNANKFTTNGTITIGFEDGAFIVSDTGVGIPESRKKDLFSWNNRMSTPGTNDEKGSGLGLPMCHEFVTAHGGQISVESTLGTGTTIRFTLS